MGGWSRLPDGPEWPDAGQGARIASVGFVLLGVLLACRAARDWPAWPAVGLSVVAVLAGIVLGVARWQKRRW